MNMSMLFSAFCLGWAAGATAIWFYFYKVRMLRSRKEWFADPVNHAKYGDDPNPDGWSY